MNKIKQVNIKGVLGEGDANETLGEGLLKRQYLEKEMEELWDQNIG